MEAELQPPVSASLSCLCLGFVLQHIPEPPSQHVPPVGCGFSSCIQGGIPKDPVRYSEINAHNPADGRERGVTIL